jgi:hypothetical protein
MTRGKKIVLGLATVWPLIYLGIFFVFFFSIFAGFADPEPPAWVDSRDGGPPDLFKVIFPLHLCTMAVTLGLLIVYVVLAIKNPRLTDTMRIIWVILILFGGMFAMPAYFWLEVWRDGAKPRPEDTPASRAY